MTVQEIIGKAIAEKREEFRASLIVQAEMHDDAAKLYTRPTQALSKRGAENQRNACLAIYDDVASGDVDAICGTLGKCVVALNVAAKLLGISAAERTAAIVAWDEQKGTAA